MSGSSWMKKYIMPSNPRLSEVVMPGSHDAGVFEDKDTNSGILGANKLAICQSGGLRSQLEAGSRVFDLRARLVRTVNLVGDGNDPFAQTPIGKKDQLLTGQTLDKGRVRFFHGGKTTGTKGGGVADQLEEVKSFLESNKSEFCILRFTKTGCPNAVTNLVHEILGDYLYTGTGNLAKHRVQLMKGCAITIFDNTFNYHSQSKGFHHYTKSAACNTGLGIAGSYAGSPWAGRVVKDQQKKLEKHVKKNLTGDRLYAWYQTQTYTTNIKTKTASGVGSKTKIKDLRKSLKHDASYECVNIVMMDFVDNYKCRQIYRRNDPVHGRDFDFETI